MQNCRNKLWSWRQPFLPFFPATCHQFCLFLMASMHVLQARFQVWSKGGLGMFSGQSLNKHAKDTPLLWPWIYAWNQGMVVAQSKSRELRLDQLRFPHFPYKVRWDYSLQASRLSKCHLLTVWPVQKLDTMWPSSAQLFIKSGIHFFLRLSL